MADPPPHARRRSPAGGLGRTRGVAIVSLAGAVALTLVLAAGIWTIIGTRVGCERRPVYLEVAASFDVAPALQEVARAFNEQTHPVGSVGCALVAVHEEQPSRVAGTLTGERARSAGLGRVDAWMPDSSHWVDLVRSTALGAASIRGTLTSAARSPVVLATPENVAGEVRAVFSADRWELLFPPSSGGPGEGERVQAQLPDPEQSAAGLVALLAARRVLGTSPAAADEFTGFIRHVQASAELTDRAVVDSFVTLAQPPFNVRPVTVTSEQAVWSYNSTRPATGITPLYPSAGTLDLDYPFVVTTRDSEKAQAADQFGAMVRSRFANRIMQRHGFRAPDRSGSTDLTRFGVRAIAPRTLPVPAPGDAGAVLQAWNRLALGTRALVLADISGAMLAPLEGGGLTRMELTRRSAQLGLTFFPDNTDLGLWEFASRLDGDRPYRPSVSLGPLPEVHNGLISRRRQLQEIAGTLQARRGVRAGLYESVLAAYDEVKRGYKADKFNAVLVLTTGRDTEPGGLSLEELVTRLREAYDPRRPVTIVPIAFGDDADTAALAKIAEVTHGESYVVHRAEEIGSVFFDAIARRICFPNCR